MVAVNDGGNGKNGIEYVLGGDEYEIIINSIE